MFAFVLTFAPSALAWDVVAIPNQALNAGNTGSVAVSTTGLFGSPLISWSVKRGVSLAGLCSYTNTAAPPPGMTITPGEDRREATLRWTGEHTYHHIGVTCVEVTACQLLGGECHSKTFRWTVNKRGSKPASVRPIHDYVYVAGDTYALEIPHRFQNVRNYSASDITSTLSVLSCPAADPECNGSALPSWVASTTSPDPRIIVQPPAGATPGDWVFRALPLTAENEDNDTRAYADRLLGGHTLSPSLSSATDVDVFAIYAETGESFTASTGNPTGLRCTASFDTYMRLLNSAGTVLAVNDNRVLLNLTNYCAGITHTATYTGWHYVEVYENGKNATLGSYRMTLNYAGEPYYGAATFTVRIPDPADVNDPYAPVELEPANDAPETAPLIGEGMTGDLGIGDEEWWVFLPGNPRYPEQFEARLPGGCTAGDLRLRLYEQQSDGSRRLLATSVGNADAGCPRIGPDHLLKPDVIHYLVLDEPTGTDFREGWTLEEATFFPWEDITHDFSRKRTQSSYGALAAGASETRELLSLEPGDVVRVEVSDGNGGCPGPARLEVTPPSGSLLVDTGTTSASQRCAAIELTATSAGGVSVVLKNTSAQTVSDYWLHVSVERGEEERAAPSWEVGDTDITIQYGRCNETVALTTDTAARNADYMGVFWGTSAADPTCVGEVDAQSTDGLGVCRYSAGTYLDEVSPRWTVTPRGAVTANDASYIGYTDRVFLQPIQRDRAHDDDAALGQQLNVTWAWGGNDVYPLEADLCDDLIAQRRCTGRGLGHFCPAGDCPVLCGVDARFLEGEHVVLPFVRENRHTSVSLKKCLSEEDEVCSQTVMGAVYNSANDELRWEVPPAANNNTHYFLMTVTGTHGETPTQVRATVRTSHRAFPTPTGPDLYQYALRRYFDGKQGRSLARGDRIAISPHEDLSLRWQVKNRGTSTGGSTTVKIYATPERNGSADAPTASSLVLDTLNLGNVAAGGTAQRLITLSYADVMRTTELGVEPHAIWIQIQQSSTFPEGKDEVGNNLMGPYLFVADLPPDDLLPAPMQISTDPDLETAITAVSPGSVFSGDELLVYARVAGTNLNDVVSDVAVRFYGDQPGQPDAATGGYDEVLLDVPSSGAAVYAVGALAIQKPNQPDNTLHVRVFADATDVLSGEKFDHNNHAPSVSTPYDVVVQNSAPTFLTSPTVTLTEDVTWTYTVRVADADEVDRSRMTLTSIGALPPGMTWTSPAVLDGNGKRRTLSWKPTEAHAQPGGNSYPITLRTCDGDPVAGGAGACTNQAFTLVVTRVDDQPAFTSSPITSATEETPYSYTVTASDEEAAELSFRLVTGPSGMTLQQIDGFSALLSWVPDDPHVLAPVPVTLEIDDGTHDVLQAFTINVSNVNDDPALGAPSTTTGSEDALFDARLPLSDADIDVVGLGQRLTCSLQTAPAWLSVQLVTSPTRACRVFGTPRNGDTGPAIPVTVRAVDNGVPTGSVTRAFTLAIADVNDPVSLGSPSATTATQGVPYAAVLTVSDDDIDSPSYAEDFTYTLLQGPAGMALTKGSNQVTASWTPGPYDVVPASRTVEVQVQDARGSSDTTLWTLTIVNVNDAPVLATPANATRQEGQSYAATLSAVDADVEEGTGDALEYFLVGGAPPGFVVESDGDLRLPTIDDAQVGVWSITVGVRDAASEEDTATFTLTVNNVPEDPTLAPLANASTAEDAPYTRTVSASDPDPGAVLTYTLPVAPAGMSITKLANGNGRISWTPSNANVGPNTVTVRVTDETGRFVERTFTLTVTNVNDTPVIVSSPNTNATQDQLWEYTLIASDPDAGDDLTLTAPLLPAWLTFDANTGYLSGRPSNDEVGDHDVTLRATDEAGSFVEQDFTIAVANVNDPPTLDPVPPQEAAEGDTVTFSVTTDDPDGDTVTVTAEGLPTGATFDGTTFTWVTTFGDDGYYEVTLTASDGALSVEQIVTVTIGDVNRPPVLAAIGARQRSETGTFAFTVSASDPDVGDTLTLSATGVAGADPFARGATFDPLTGQFEWTTDHDDAGVYLVTFVVSDGALLDSEDVTLTVLDTNRAPVFDATPPTTTNEDAPFAFTASATDPDGDVPSYSLREAPAGMTLDGASGALAWSPVQADVGAHSVVVRALDGRGGVKDLAFTLEVLNVNDAPVFTSTPTTTAQEDTPFLYTATADDEDPSDTLTFSATVLPAWLTFTPATGALSGTPGDDDGGAHPVTLRVTDAAGAFAEQTFTVTVSVDNDPPVLVPPTPSAPVAASEGVPVAFTVAAEDPDGPSLSYSATGLPEGASLHPTTGAFTWTPDFDQAGTAQVTVTASDTLATDSRVITIQVANVDRPPTITAPPSAEVAEGEQLALVVSGADPDDDAVTLSLESGPAGASFHAASGQLTWTPGYDDAGQVAFVFRATAGGAFVEATTTVTVLDTNRAPVVTSAAPASATEDQPYAYPIVASDADGDPLSYEITAGAANASVDASGLFSWVPTGAQTGARNFTVTVRDGRGGATPHAFTIAVAAVNDLPVLTSTPPLAATEDQPWRYEASASDEESQSLAWSLDQAPSGMSAHPSTGVVTWTPTNDHVGDNDVTLRVTDGDGGFVTQSFTVAVANVNDAPRFIDTPAPAATVAEGAAWSWTPAVVDDDAGDTVTLALVSGPSGLALDGDTFRFTPANGQLGTFSVTVSARDQSGAEARRTFDLTVLNVNDAPYFTSSPIDATVEEEGLFVGAVTAADDDPGDELTFSLLGAPARLEIDPQTGALLFTPDDDEVGVHAFTIRVDDLEGAFAEQDAVLTVTAVNDAPVLSAIGDRQVLPGVTLTITLSATDPDGPSTTFSANGLPPGATLTGNAFTFTPTEEDEGVYVVTFRVSDGALSDSEQVAITVGDGVPPPTLTLPDDVTVNEGDALSRTISATAPNGGVVTLAASGLPAGATFVPTTGAFSWTPGFEQAGVWPLTFSATSEGGVREATWTITVRDKNRLPVIDVEPSGEATEGALWSGQISATDPDGDVVSYQLVTGPAGMTVDPTSGAISFTPTYAQVGLRAFELRVSDGKGGVVQRTYYLVVHFRDDDEDRLPDTWELANGTDPTVDDADADPDTDGLTHLDEYQGGTDPFVSNAPSAPVLIAPADGARVDTSTPTLVWLPSSDPDGDDVSYDVQVAPAADPEAPVFSAEDLVAAGPEVSVTVDVELDEGAEYVWRVRASDGRGLSPYSAVRAFRVDAINEAPGAPTVIAPPHNSTVATMTPTLRVNAPLDPDGDAVTVVFRVRESAGAEPLVTSSPLPPSGGSVSFAVPELLADGSAWVWEAEATDARGLGGPLGGPWRFTVDLTNEPPPAPVLLAPEEDELVSENPPTLVVTAVSDPEGAPVVYTFAISTDPSFAPETTDVIDGVTATGDEVSVTPTAPLDEGWLYWRVTASDGSTFSDFAESRFLLDSIDDPPPAPAPLAPADNALAARPVTLVVATVADPEGTPLSYTFEVSEPAGGQVVATLSGVLDDDDGAEDGQVSATFPDLVAGQRYAWRARADEDDGLSSPWSTTRTFRVESSDERPAAPVLLAPIETSVPADEPITFRFQPAADADGDLLGHDLEVFVDGSLAATLAALTADESGEVVATLSVDGDGPASWRARGRDAVGAGPWASATFVIEPPSVVDGGPGDDDAGPGDDGGVEPGDDAGPRGDAGEPERPVDYDPKAPVVTRVSADPPRLPAGCSCDSSSSLADLSLLGLALLGLLGRRVSRRSRRPR